MLPTKPQRPKNLANFVMFLVQHLVVGVVLPRALGDRLFVGSSCNGQSAMGSEKAEDEIRFAGINTV